MNTSVVIYSGDLRTENVHLASGSSIITDAPKDNFGKGEYFSPTDLLATSLANCILTTMAIATRKREIDLKGSKATVTKTMGVEPRRVVKIDVAIELPESVIQFKDELEHAAHNCPVAKSLHPDIQQNVRFSYVLLK
ncbi:MAG: OsmC family protein [Bacteroidota bacterium]